MVNDAVTAPEHGAPSARWADPDFRKLWTALSVSLLGSQVTALALPLLAAITLGATPVQMGLLAAALKLPFLFVSLPAGIWVDRLRRRPLLIACDIGSALLLVTLPLAAVLGQLGLVQLLLVALGLGILEALGEIAHYAYVPSLVGHERLGEANSRLHVSHSVAAAAGPGLGGVLVQVFTAPIAVLVDAGSFLYSAALLRGIARPEPPRVLPVVAEPALQAIAAGLRSLLTHPLLRPIILSSVATGLCLGAFDALVILFVTRELAFKPATVGLIFAAGGATAVVGAMFAGAAARRWGMGWTILGGWVIDACTRLVVPLVAGPPAVAVAILTVAYGIGGASGTVANVHQWTLRQAVTPEALQGRITAGHRFLVYGAIAIGALAGGALGAALGLRQTLFLAAAGMMLARLAAFASPLRRLVDQPGQS